MAAHQIAINCASVSYMVPLGVSSAAAVAVGQAIGRGGPAAARRTGYIAVGLGLRIHGLRGAVFLVFP